MNEQEPPDPEAQSSPGKAEGDVEPGIRPEPPPDIEHVHVADDPRTWSPRKKTWTLVYISYCSLAGATLANI